jgi:hypothetical protein
MPSTVDSPKSYPVVCPGCDEPKGYPYGVRTLSDLPNSIEVKLRCRDCNHEWTLIVTSRE